MAKTTKKTFPGTATAKIVSDAGGITVEVLWKGAGITEARGAAWGMTVNHAKLAQRLAACINAQAYIELPQLKTRADGSTYVYDHAAWNLFGRTLNSDLRQRGF